MHTLLHSATPGIRLRLKTPKSQNASREKQPSCTEVRLKSLDDLASLGFKAAVMGTTMDELPPALPCNSALNVSSIKSRFLRELL